MKEKSVLYQLFVDLCEYDFEERMNHVCRKLIRKPSAEIISISGPSCSGKTTLANKIIGKLRDGGLSAYCISIDDYFKDRDTISDQTDMDSVKAIDLDALDENIKNIKNKKTLKVPAFDFLAAKRIGHRIVDPADFDVFVFEGIQAIYPEVVSLFSGSECRSVYISVADDPVAGGVSFDKREIRFMRRLVRDFRFRGADAERTFNIWYDSVIPNEEKCIDPNIKNVDIRITSYMPYEIFVLKPLIQKILSDLPKDSKYCGKAAELLDKISDFECISEDYIPEGSFYREFIG